MLRTYYGQANRQCTGQILEFRKKEVLLNLLVARATFGISRMECTQIERVHRVADLVCKLAFGQPFLLAGRVEPENSARDDRVGNWSAFVFNASNPDSMTTVSFCRADT